MPANSHCMASLAAWPSSATKLGHSRFCAPAPNRSGYNSTPSRAHGAPNNTLPHHVMRGSIFQIRHSRPAAALTKPGSRRNQRLLPRPCCPRGASRRCDGSGWFDVTAALLFVVASGLEAQRLGFGQCDAFLALVLAATVGVAGLAHFVALKEQHLRAALARVNTRWQRRGV